MFACLDRGGVRYVLIGGLAAVLQGSPLPTLGIDICPAPDDANLVRLAATLKQIDARVRAADIPEGIPFACEASFLKNVQVLNLVTRFGDLDLSFRPSGTEGFDDLAQHALEVSIGRLRVQVAALEDIIRSKEAANRPKDHRTLPVLRQLLEEIRRRRDAH